MNAMEERWIKCLHQFHTKSLIPPGNQMTCSRPYLSLKGFGTGFVLILSWILLRRYSAPENLCWFVIIKLHKKDSQKWSQTEKDWAKQISSPAILTHTRNLLKVYPEFWQELAALSPCRDYQWKNEHTDQRFLIADSGREAELVTGGVVWALRAGQ